MNDINSNFKRWISVCSRLVDYGILYLIISGLALFLPVQLSALFYLVVGLALPLLFAPLGALLLSTWGKTVGMALFGVSIRDLAGGKLRFWPALRRSLFGSQKKTPTQLIKTGGRMAGLMMVCACLGGGLTLHMFKESLVSRTVHETVAGWLNFTAAEAGFSVDFPGEARLEEKTLEVTRVRRTLNYTEFSSSQNPNIHYSVSYIQLPKKWGLFGSSTLLKGALSVICENSFEAQLSSKFLTNYARYPALDFQINEGENEVKGRLILVGTTIYKVAVVYPHGFTEDLRLAEFLNSLELSNPV